MESDDPVASVAPSPAKKPWEHRRWRQGLCRSGLGGKAVAFWITALFFAGVIALIVIKSPRMIHFEQVRWEVLFPGFLAFIGIGFLLAALIATARWLRFGRCVVAMHHTPGVIGGHFLGEVRLPERFPSDTDVRMELICETTMTTQRKGDDNNSVSVDREWAHTLRVMVNGSLCHDGYMAVPFDFTIPYGLPDETASRVNGTTRIDIQWRLRVFARLEGPDLEVSFRVPVFKTAQSDPAVTGDPDHGKNLETLLHDTGEKRRLRIEHVQGMQTYICDAQGLQKGVCLVPLIIGGVMLAVAILVPCNALPDLLKEVFAKAEGWANLFRLMPLVMAGGVVMMMGVFGLFAILFLTIGLRGLIARQTWIEQGTVHQRLRFLCFSWRRSCPCAEITGVNLGDTTKSGGKTWYDIVLERNAVARCERFEWRVLFKRITVATNVPTAYEAEHIATRLRQELKLPVASQDTNP